MKPQFETADFLKPMQPFPGLESYARLVPLAHAGINIYCYDTGGADRPVALLIHGLGDEADTWRHLIGPLSSTRRVIALDLPGFGRSDKPDVACSEDFMLAAMFEFLQVLSIEKALLIGHSLGAALAHRIALERPSLASGLVLIDGSALIKPQKLNLAMILFMIPGVGEWIYTRLRKDPQAAYQSLAPYYADLSHLPTIDQDFLYLRVNQRVWSDKQRWAYFSTLRHFAAALARPAGDLESRLAQLHVPTLVIWGEKDQVYAPVNGAALPEIQPDARLVILPGLSHNTHQDDPQAVLQAILTDERFE